jgi:hypothetical protein
MPEESGICAAEPIGVAEPRRESILGETGICAAAARMCFIKKPS